LRQEELGPGDRFEHPGRSDHTKPLPALVTHSQQYKNGQATFRRKVKIVDANPAQRFAAETVAHYNPSPSAAHGCVATQHSSIGRTASIKPAHGYRPNRSEPGFGAGLAAALIMSRSASADPAHGPAYAATGISIAITDSHAASDIAETVDTSDLNELTPGLPLPHGSRPQ
jgi:hypothetical protein